MFQSTKMFELGSCAFRQWKSDPNAVGYENLNQGESSAKRGIKCFLNHGYLLKAGITFSCDELDHRNWCVDFGSLRPLKDTFQEHFDHKTHICRGDPLLPLFQQLHDAGGCDLKITNGVGIEKTAEWCYHAAQKFIDEETKSRCWVSKVEVWEHELNSAIYIPDPLEQIRNRSS